MKIWNIVIKNILLALLLLIVLIFIVMLWLNIYTHHGQQINVPDVKGMQVEEAALFFRQTSLQYEVIDSMFVRNKPAGSILETNPPAGTNVKKSRTIYLTVNSTTAQMLIVPQVMNMSRRQAEATLRTLGFESIRIRSVPEAYKDLVLGLEKPGGIAVMADERIPANTPLVLLVSSGAGENPEDEGLLNEYGN